MDDAVLELENRLGYAFSDAKLLSLALTHASVSGDAGGVRHDNERLEFLGDAVLELCVSEHLYAQQPPMREGMMTRVRAALVCEDTLYRVADTLNLGAHLTLAHGAESTGGRHKPSILSDCFEAVLGAVYLDGGMDAARALVKRHVLPMTPAAAEITWVKDCKTRLQESLTPAERAVLAYVMTDAAGPDHSKTFRMEVRLGSRVIGAGSGSSKQSAGQQAAKDALEKLGMGERICD